MSVSDLGYPVADVHVKKSSLVSNVSKNDWAICVKMHVLKTHMQLVSNCSDSSKRGIVGPLAVAIFAFPKTELV